MKWPWVRRKTHLRDLETLRTRMRADVAAERTVRKRDNAAFDRMRTALDDLSISLAMHQLPRLHAIETEPEFTYAVAERVRMSESFHTAHGRMPVGYEVLHLHGIEFRACADRPGCVTLVPEVAK